jgi:hypothetical protein
MGYVQNKRSPVRNPSVLDIAGQSGNQYWEIDDCAIVRNRAVTSGECFAQRRSCRSARSSKVRKRMKKAVQRFYSSRSDSGIPAFTRPASLEVHFAPGAVGLATAGIKIFRQ